ncbi:SLAC1 anion channel family protein [Marinobacter sp. NFXS9]
MTAFAELKSKSRGKESSIRNLPVNLFASVMGIAGLSIAWRQAAQAFGVGQLASDVTGVLAVVVFVVLAIGYVVKACKHPAAVVAEFRHPIAGNFFGTITISILLLSSVIGPFNQAAGRVAWGLGVVSTFVLCFSIVGRMLKGKLGIENAVPAWFIPGVATLDIAIAGGSITPTWAHEVILFSIAVGTMIALLFFVMVMSRMIHHEPVADGMIPSLMILMAPFEVGFLAYTNFLHRIDSFSGMLFYFGLFSRPCKNAVFRQPAIYRSLPIHPATPGLTIK